MSQSKINKKSLYVSKHLCIDCNRLWSRGQWHNEPVQVCKMSHTSRFVWDFINFWLCSRYHWFHLRSIDKVGCSYKKNRYNWSLVDSWDFCFSLTLRMRMTLLWYVLFNEFEFVFIQHSLYYLKLTNRLTVIFLLILWSRAKLNNQNYLYGLFVWMINNKHS